MNNPFNNLPSYIKETPKFSQFLSLMSTYLISAAEEVAQLKESFLADEKSVFVVKALASQLGVVIKVPFKDGVPDLPTYYKQLFLAYRAKSFVSMFKGTEINFLTGDPVKDKISIVVLDFSIARPDDNRSPMSVVYSVLSMDSYFTLDIAKEYLVPKVTGVNASLYYLQYGQNVFGYDIDEIAGIKIGSDHVNTIPITGGADYVVSGASINALGSGYAIGDILTTAKGVWLRVLTLEAGSLLAIVNVSQTYAEEPAGTGLLVVTGGGGTGMTVNVTSRSGKSYYISGYDKGSFVSISRRS